MASVKNYFKLKYLILKLFTRAFAGAIDVYYGIGT